MSEAISIVGAGAMGTALAHAFTVAGVRVAAVASRHAERAGALARALQGVRAVSLADVGATAPVVLLSVSDSAIEAACSEIRPAAGTLVAHVSGSRTVAALDAVRAAGGLVGGFHPLAAASRHTAAADVTPDVTPDAWASIFRGAVFAIEGDVAVQSRLAPLARALGGKAFPIAGSDKPLYHLGASMLAAFSAGLAQIAWDNLRAAGAPPGVASAGVGHLLRTVATNVERAPSPADALTGSVARGDAVGVRRQAEVAHAMSPAVQAIYRAHVAHSIELARAAGRIDESTAQALAGALTTPDV